jgi:hypothetical protein
MRLLTGRPLLHPAGVGALDAALGDELPTLKQPLHSGSAEWARLLRKLLPIDVEINGLGDLHPSRDRFLQGELGPHLTYRF